MQADKATNPSEVEIITQRNWGWKFSIDNNYVTLDDFDGTINMGYLYYDHERNDKNYDSQYPDFMKVFKEYLAAECEEFQDFIAAHN